ncbi:MAG: leucyl aminopeptidase [Synergistaceae bacterium]|nr:leucyl aminopeptidase [Synergistaceae bacterium]
MEFKVYEGRPDEFTGGAVLLALSEESVKSCDKKNSAFAELIIELAARKDFVGKKGSLMRVPLFNNNNKNIYLLGLGKAADINSQLVRDKLANAFRTIGRQHNNSLLLMLDNCVEIKADILYEAAELASYKFDKYKTKKSEDKDSNNKDDKDDNKFALSEIFVADKLCAKCSAKGKIFAESQILTRELANEPGCEINPPVLAEIAAAQAKEFNLECEIWDEVKLKAEGCGAILAVGAGSATPPRMIHLVYKPKNKARKKIAFVGKGITFDSGGLDIKPANFMTTMKGDKTGACDVLGILTGAARLELEDIEVHGFMAAAENMPSGSAFRPDDIIKARNGKTIEIDNTDAEGRLVLADALCLASELKPDAIIDMATLTGACMVALGKWRAGLFAKSKDDALAEEILSAAKRRGEDFWRLPAEDEHIEEELKSPFADMINSGPRYGGATFAAIFLSQFVDKDIAWAHLDIAGVDFFEKEWGVYSKGASGFAVRTCLDYLANL